MKITNFKVQKNWNKQLGLGFEIGNKKNQNRRHLWMQCPTNLKAKLYRQEKIQKFKYQRSLLLLLSGIGIYIAHVTPISVRSQEFSGEKNCLFMPKYIPLSQ